MIRRPPRSTRTDTLFPSTTPFRSGRIRYLGVMLYDADRIQEAASVPAEKDLYQAHLDIFLDPFDPEVIAAARREGIPDSWLEGAKASPVYKLAIDWKLADRKSTRLNCSH